MRATLRSFLIWSGIAVAALFCWSFGTLTTLVSFLWDYRRRAFAQVWPRTWAKCAVACNPAWSAHVDERRIPSGRHFVVVANHQSLADIIICLHMQHLFKFLSKSSVFKVPCVGWFMYLAGYIQIDRKNKHSIARAMEKAEEWLGRGVSVLFFPEGTRSPDGEIRPFKLGAFRLAVRAGVDVLPLYLSGTADLLPKNSFKFTARKTPMRLVAGDPIPVAGLTMEDVPQLAERARQAVLALKAEQDAQLATSDDATLRAAS